MSSHPLMRRLGSLGLSLVTWGVVVAFLAPLLWILTTALKNRVEAFQLPPKLIFTPTWSNFAAVMGDSNFLHYYLNSIIVAVFTTVVSLILGLPAAYALARFRFRGRKDIAFWLLTTRMAPPIAIVLPLYIMFQKLGLLDTYPALIIPNVIANTGFIVWLLRSFFRDLPQELDEAARVDGCGYFGAFWHIVLPNVRNGIVAAAIISFIFTWNEYLFSLLLTSSSARTATVAITNFVTFTGINWGRLCAAALIVAGPVFLIAMVAQRWIIKGLTMGAVK